MSDAPEPPSDLAPIADGAARHGLKGDALQAAEAYAFRQLVRHLRARTDVQNIDLMELSGMCRNCLSRWFGEGAAEQGVELDKAAAREVVYGIRYDEWKRRYQT